MVWLEMKREHLGDDDLMITLMTSEERIENQVEQLVAKPTTV